MGELGRFKNQAFLFVQHRRIPLWIAWGLAAFVIQTGFILLALVPGWRAHPVLFSDAISYFTPAQNLASHGMFSSHTAEPYLWEPYRTPGYPLLIALSLQVFGRPEGALFVAALFSGLAAALSIRLCQAWNAGKIAQHACGLFVSLLPNSLGLSAYLYTDALTGFIFLVWVVVFFHWRQKGQLALLIFGVCSLVLLQLLKPTFFIAHLLVLWGCIVLPGGQSRQKRFGLAIFLVALTIVPLSLAAIIARDHGVIAPNLLGVQAFRYYAQVELLVRKNGGDFKQVQQSLGLQDDEAANRLAAPISYEGRLYLVQQAEVKEALSKDMWPFLEVMVQETVQQFAAPQEFAFKVFWSQLPTWGRTLGSLLTLSLWALALAGGWWLGRTTSWRLPLFWAGLLIFFLITGSVSQRIGARLRFPADMACVPLMAVGFEVLVQRFRTLIRTAKPGFKPSATR